VDEGVFFPAIQERRTQYDYEGKVLLRLDSLGSHHTDDFVATCSEWNIDVPFLVPHSSGQTRPLDLFTFGLMKRRLSGSRFDRLANPQSNRLVRILGAWAASSSPHHNVVAFMNIGLVPFEEPRVSGEDYLRVELSAARGVRQWAGEGEDRDDAPLQPEGRRMVRLPTGE
jgi:hypothetical protein